MLTDLLIAIICTAMMSMLGLVIFVRNPRNKINQFFGLLSFSISSWTIFNYVSGGTSVNKLTTQLVFFFGVMTAFSLIMFMINFPVENLSSGRLLGKSLLYTTPIMLIVIFLPQFIVKVTKDNIDTGSLYYVFIAYALLALVSLVYLSIKQIRESKNKTTKQQAKLVAFGVLLYAVFAVLSNVIIPLFINNWQSSRFGPVFSLLLVGMVAYSIAKHKLFDIRSIIARSLAYILSIGTITFLYGLLLFIVSKVFFSSQHINVARQILYIAGAIFLGIFGPLLKRFFDKLTNKLFFRGAYDAQQLLDNLNKILISTIDLYALVNASSRLIRDTLRAEYCLFQIKKSTSSEGHLIGALSGDQNLGFKGIPDRVLGLKNNILVTDQITRDLHLKKELSDNNIALIAKLSVVTKDGNQTVGHIIIGPKSTGGVLTGQDIRVVELIADEMAIAVQNASRFEEIQQFNVTLQQKVDEATHKLRQANEKLRALDETKDEFISMASHQLRTPLTSVKGYVSMVLEGDAGKISANQRKLLDQSFLSAQRMVYLIADLLNVSRLKTGKFVIDAAPTNLADLIEGELEQLKQTAASREITLTYDKPKDFPMLMLDETKTRQVVMNFADNAIYYTPAGGHININLVDKGDTIEFTVVDDGIGVPKHVQPHLFTKFYRADNAKKARPDGTGLGLFMAKKVVVAQGGAIIFKSEEGKGSTFGFSFSKNKLKVPSNLKTDPKKVAEHSHEPSLV